MNDCIFDWEENCRLMLSNGKCSTIRKQLREQIALFRYLMDSGCTRDDIFDKWLTVHSRITDMVRQDSDEANRQFGIIYQQAAKWKIPKQGNEITIYKEELDVLNNYNISTWMRIYFFALLVCYKYYGKEWCKFDKEIRTFCFSLTPNGKEKTEYAPKIKEILKKKETYTVKTSGASCLLKMNIAKDNGSIVAKIPNPRHIVDILYLLDNRKICEICGKRFELQGKARKAKMCPECAKSKKRAYYRNWWHENK